MTYGGEHVFNFTYHLIVTNHASLLPLIDSPTDAMIDHIGCL